MYAEDKDDRKIFKQKKEKYSNLIVRSLANGVLRAVFPDVGHPYQMLQRLREKWDSKSNLNRVTKATGLTSVKYLFMQRNNSLHIDQI